MSIRLVLSVLALVLVSSACVGGPSSTLGPTPSSGAVAATPVAPSPSGQFLPYLARPVTTVNPAPPPLTDPLGFSCKLPIYFLSPQGPPRSEVGFLSIPEGSLVLQPAPAVPADNPIAFYFDRAYSRWLPVGRGSVSPDGRRYAYMSWPDNKRGLLNIVDVVSGGTRTLPATYTQIPGSPERYVVLDYSNDGIYLGLAYEGPIRGLWLMNPNSGEIRLVADLAHSYLQAMAGTALWLGTVNPADPNPAPSGLVPAADSLDRFDVATRTRTPWMYLPGRALWVVAVDPTGHPIVMSGQGPGGGFDLMLVASPGVGQLIGTLPAAALMGTPLQVPGGPIADSHGVWIGTGAGVYLYSPTLGLRKVSSEAASPGNGCE